ncbi:hypothetical protein DFP94_101503 [Fontibacillus phaseoli]|uniref:Uncharacterized protein n=1 Tax=Fontibacillus phaseoli TaxID=1416533 RepID=A0A369BTH5_9BACL|nr:hypothetical protein [Fontibacillus phaseoli]RCX22914.1 hypothetical protein DFP94_101503 [Fontibacillus phaseoli]
MILLPDNGNTCAHLIVMQRVEVASLENSVEIYAGLLAKYERKLAEARRRLAKSENYLR